MTGYRKPEHEIYRIALKKAGAEPVTTIFIDDNEENVNAAKELGLYSSLFRTKEGLLKTLDKVGIPIR